MEGNQLGSKEKPLKAITKITVGITKIHQDLEFHYYDPSGEFFNLQQTGALEGEIEFMRQNMDYYLKQDKLFLNNLEIPLHVKSCQVFFPNNGFQKPVTRFLIESDSYSLKRGVNTIKLIASEEKIDYPCYSTWEFPGMILKIVTAMNFTIEGHAALLDATIGDHVGGSEEFKFLNP